MRTAKLAFIYSTIVVFLCFSTIGALGAFGKIEISGWATAAAIIGPILAIVSAAIGAKHIFDDPDAITELKGEHAEKIRDMEHGHADFVAERVAAERETESKHRGEVAKLQAEIAALKSKLVDTEKARQELHRKYTDIMPKARPIGQSFIASGSAKTQQPPQE